MSVAHANINWHPTSLWCRHQWIAWSWSVDLKY